MEEVPRSTEAPAPTWRERLRPLSPLTVVLAAGLLVSGWLVPRTARSVLEMSDSYGEEPGQLVHFAAGFGWYALVAVVVSLLVAKDWRLRTERARVWANLAAWLVLGLALGVVTQAVMAPIYEVTQRMLAEGTR